MIGSRKVLSPAVCNDFLTNTIEALAITFVLPRGRVSGVCCQGRCCRGQWKCDGTRAETRFRLLVKRTSPFKSAGASVQSTTDSRGVRISGSNVGYTMFRGSVKGTGYTLHSPVSPSLPLPCVTVCHHISAGVHSAYCHTPEDISLHTRSQYPVYMPLLQLTMSSFHRHIVGIALSVLDI